MMFAPVVLAALVAWSGLTVQSQQAAVADPLPLRVTWGALNSDGYAMVTVTNESPLAATAWAIGVTITRPDGSKVSRRASATDGLGSWIALKARPDANLPPAMVLSPGGSRVQPIKVESTGGLADFSFTVDAVVLEDGTVLGNRQSVARMLAAREADAATAERWLAAFEMAAAASDTETAAGILQRALDSGLPTDRTALSLKSTAERAVTQRGNATLFRSSIDYGLKYASATIAECRRHLGR